MVIVNFAHPLTDSQLAALEQITGGAVERVIEAARQFDHGQPFAEQARLLVEGVGLTPREWQTAALVVNLPSLNTIAALVLAELHGRMGYFPAVLRLRPVAGSTPPRYEVAEVLNLQVVRDAARETRSASCQE